MPPIRTLGAVTKKRRSALGEFPQSVTSIELENCVYALWGGTGFMEDTEALGRVNVAYLEAKCAFHERDKVSSITPY
jgi:hypothetical protein